MELQKFVADVDPVCRRGIHQSLLVSGSKLVKWVCMDGKTSRACAVDKSHTHNDANAEVVAGMDARSAEDSDFSS